MNKKLWIIVGIVASVLSLVSGFFSETQAAGGVEEIPPWVSLVVPLLVFLALYFNLHRDNNKVKVSSLWDLFPSKYNTKRCFYFFGSFWTMAFGFGKICSLIVYNHARVQSALPIFLMGLAGVLGVILRRQ